MILFTIVLVCRVRIIVVIVLVCSTLCEYALLWWGDMISLRDYMSQEYRFYCSLFSHGFYLMQRELRECGKGPAWYGITSSNVQFVKIHASNVQTYRESETRVRWMHVMIKQNL